MQQKKLDDVPSEVFRSFKTNKQLSQSLRQSYSQPVSDRYNKLAVKQKFPSGAQYVQQARLELQNQPLIKVQQEETLKNKLNFVKTESTKNMIEQQIISRRQRHLTTLDNFEEFIESYQKEEYTIFKETQMKTKKLLKQIDKNLKSYFETLTDEYLLSKEIEFLSENEIKIQEDAKHRSQANKNLDKQLSLALKSYTQKYNSMIQIAKNDLMDISFILDPEINVLIDNLTQTQNKKIEEIEKRNLKLIENIQEEIKNGLIILEESNLYYIQQWRSLKHNQAMEAFKAEISLDDYVYPDSRKLLYKNLNDTQQLIFENRQGLLGQLKILNIEFLTHQTIENFQKDASRLNDYSNSQYDKIISYLMKNIEDSKNKLFNRKQKLQEQLMIYNAQLQKPLEEILEEEVQHLINTIIENDKQLLQNVIYFTQVLNYQDENDFYGQDILNNVSNYYDEIAKKLDKFKKDQEDFKLKYEVQKAKAADQNEDELDKIEEKLEVQFQNQQSKKALKNSIHHPLLVENLADAFLIVDEQEKKIREFYDINIQIAREHPDQIKDLFQNFEIICAPHFNMAPEFQRKELQKTIEEEYHEKIKLIIQKEIEDQEREAQEQAQKKGGKTAPKKDAKKVQQEYEQRWIELTQEHPKDSIEEFVEGGRTWVQFQKLDIIINNIIQVKDLKGYESPVYRGENLINPKLRFTSENLLDTILTFRAQLFKSISDNLKLSLDEADTLDKKFLENNLIILDDRLKKNYPIKGQIEVEIYMVRSSQITQHKAIYERHTRQIIDKNIVFTNQYNSLILQAIQLNQQYVDYQNELKDQLTDQSALSKLQGVQNRGKDQFQIFSNKMEDLVLALLDLSVGQPNELLNQNSKYVEQMRHNQEYSEEEISWYQDMIQEVDKDIEAQKQEKVAKFEEIKAFLAKNHKESFDQLEAQYKISQEELAQKDGTGKQFGRPKRLCQEKIRLEMTKCEEAQENLEKLFQKIQNTANHQELRKFLITFRNCISRYAFHLDAFTDKAPEQIRFSRTDTKPSPLVLSEEVDLDKQNQEIELETLGPLSYQTDKSKKLQILVFEIEKMVKEECQKIYVGPSAKWLNGVDKLTDWIRPYLENMKKNMHNFRITCCLKLCVKFYEFGPKISSTLILSLFMSAREELSGSKNMIKQNLTIIVANNSTMKDIHTRELRPNLSNPSCKEELEIIITKEKTRQENFNQNYLQLKEQFGDHQFKISTEFLVRLLNNNEFLLGYFDNMILFEDFIFLPGDENIIKKKNNLQTLLKQKQDQKQVDYNSLRSISKLWSGVPLNLFNIGHREFKFQQNVLIQEEVKTKGKTEKKTTQQEQVIQQVQTNDNESKQIKSFKTPCQVSASKVKNQVFKEYSEQYQQIIQDYFSQFEQIELEEQKFAKKWQKNLKDLFN